MSARLSVEMLRGIRDMVASCEKHSTGEPWTSAARGLLTEIDALTADLKRATTKPSVEAGELAESLAALLSAPHDENEPARLIQRALDAAEERGAEADREQRGIERRHGGEL